MKNATQDYIKHPYELFGIECGKGWHSLLKPIFDYIEKYNQDKTEEDKIKIQQIKEKFGGLRVYTNFHTDELDEIISNAEDESFSTCETCGTKKNVGSTVGWMSTCCKDCVIKHAEKSYYPLRWYSFADKRCYWVYDDGRFEDIDKIDENKF